MKKFTAVVTNGTETECIMYHSMFKGGSIMNRADCLSQMKAADLDTDIWRIVSIDPKESLAGRRH